MISHWLRELPFRQKINMNKLYSYKKTIQKNTDVYIQLDIYMKLPHPTNPLQILKYESIAKNYNEILYQTLHKETYVEIVEISRRKWIRILFSSIEKVLEAHHLFLFTTFKFYYNGFFIELFNHFETQEEAKLEIY